MSTPALLHSLLTAPGPPGHEEAPATIWREAAEEFADEVTLDAMGNSVARVNGSGDHPLLAVVGHVDEIALIVSHIERQGLPARGRLRWLGSRRCSWPSAWRCSPAPDRCAA